MNAKQSSTWREIVRQCKSRLFGSINVASEVRSDAIVAANALVELVTPELAELLERVANCVLLDSFADPYTAYRCAKDRQEVRGLTARIREALEIIE